MDALDECEQSEREALIERVVKFFSVQNVTNTELKFLVTSRPYFEIETEFSTAGDILAEISLKGEDESEKISKEIDLVIDEEILRIARARRYPLETEVQDGLVKYLKSIKHRTYLWLHLILDVIRKTPAYSQTKLEALISKIPDSVDNAYESILNRVKNPERAKARRLLHIIVAAERPLTLQEMNVALEIGEKLDRNEDCRSVDDLEKFSEGPFKMEVRNLCGLFVSIKDSKIYLIHQTAKEFLVKNDSIQPLSVGIWRYSLEPRESNLIIAKICILYLLFTIFERDPLIIDDRVPSYEVQSHVSRYANRHDLLDYAAKHWSVHFRGAKITNEEIVALALEVCNSRSKRFLSWFHVYWMTVGSSSRCPQSLTDLIVGSYFGLEPVVQVLLQKEGVDVDCKDEDGRTPLSWAAAEGQLEVVKLLLEKEGADVDCKDKYGRTPLWWAAVRGQLEVVKLLL